MGLFRRRRRIRRVVRAWVPSAPPAPEVRLFVIVATASGQMINVNGSVLITAP